MNKIILFFVLLPGIVMANGGDDHGHATLATKSVSSIFTSETFSDKYEVLVKYSYFKPGTESVLRLFISDYSTNAPLDSVQLQVTVSANASIKLTVSKVDKGVYELRGIFPENKKYNLIISINGLLGPDLLQVNDIEPGKEMPIEMAEAAHQHWYNSSWFYGLLGLLGGMLLMFFVMKNRNQKIIATLILLYCLLPVNGYYDAKAHEGHNDPAASSGAASTAFLVEKETQFLFNILTEKVEAGNYNSSVVFFGTVIPAPSGKAVIQSPQTGKIVSLKVTTGQKVSKGQLLAVIEQQVDAGTQINIIAQKNIVDAEFAAAKAQYDRLKKIEDIAAKKDITEAQARYETALNNKKLFDANVGHSSGNTRFINLTSPINGVAGIFNYSIGAVVNAGETLFEIIDLDRVYIEAQVFAKDLVGLNASKKIIAHLNNADTVSYQLRQVSTAQTVNTENQSQKIVFEVLHSKGQFKLGANVEVRSFSSGSSRQVIIPNEAITEVNGRPVVFIKDKAEQYSISFISKGETNNRQTIIYKGVEEDERVVIKNVFQMKMMYLNQ